MPRAARGTSIVLAVFAIALAVAGIMAQSPSKQQQATDPRWPEKNDMLKVIAAFSAVLTQSAAAEQKDYRKQITKSTEAAKNAVQENLDKLYVKGSIVIPSEVFIMFYEPENPNGPPSTRGEKLTRSNTDSQYYHVFYLPPADGKKHEYKDHLMCCYPVWNPHP